MVGDEKHQSHLAFTGPVSSAWKLALYSAAAVVLMAADYRSGYLDVLRQKLSMLVYPVLLVAEVPSQVGRWVSETWTDHTTLAQHNRELEQRWLLAQAELNRMAALRQENERLRALLESTRTRQEKVVVAELLAVDLDPTNHRVVLNKGAYHGVYLGQPLIDAGGIVGQIESVSEFSAFAMLISDPSHAMPVAINRTGLRAIANGTGQTDSLLVEDISTSADVRSGDLLVATGLGGRFPAGFPVATVVSVIHEPGAAFYRIIARPTAALDRSRELLLMWPETPGPEPATGPLPEKAP